MDEYGDLLKAVREELEAGADPRRVDAAIREATNGRLPNFRALAATVESDRLRRESEAGLRAAEHGALSNAGRMAFQGLTFGWGDELIGMLGGNAAESRQRLEDLRTAEPGASLAAEAAGGLLLPGLGARAAARAGGLFKTAVIGAGVGGASGAVIGAGEADPGFMNRMQGALSGAETGAALGGVFAPAAAGVSRVGDRLRRAMNPTPAVGRGTRVAAELERLSHPGIDRQINKAIEEANSAVAHVREKLYKPLEEAHAVMDDPDVLAFLAREDVAPHARAAAKWTSGDATSFKDLQKLRTRLRRQDRDLASQLQEIMVEKLPGLDEADRAYSRAIGRRRAFNIGRRITTYKIDGQPVPLRNAQDIERVLADLPAEAHDAFHQGRLVEIISELEKHDEKSVDLLNQFMDAGPETRAQLRSLFPDETNYQEFLSFLQGEKATEMRLLKKAERIKRVAAAFNRLALYGTGGAAAGWAARKVGLLNFSEER